MNKINCIITDDEPIAREGLRKYIEKIDCLNLICECEDALQLTNALRIYSVDLLFLDIEMPYISGLDLLSTLENIPRVIITSAYANYALQSYEYEVTDYLLKPISFGRFNKAVNRVKELIYSQLSNDDSEYIYVRSDYHRLNKIFIRDIMYIESQQNYIYVYTSENRFIIRSTLSGFSKQLPNDIFVQIHKSFIVNIKQVSCVDSNFLTVNGKQLVISRTFRDEFLKKIL